VREPGVRSKETWCAGRHTDQVSNFYISSVLGERGIKPFAPPSEWTIAKCIVVVEKKEDGHVTCSYLELSRSFWNLREASRIF
jgi:hypothetical protein